MHDLGCKTCGASLIKIPKIMLLSAAHAKLCVLDSGIASCARAGLHQEDNLGPGFPKKDCFLFTIYYCDKTFAVIERQMKLNRIITYHL